MLKIPALALILLAAVALLGVIVLAAIGVAIPDVLSDCLKVLAGGAAGAAIPSGPTPPAAGQ